MINPLSKQPKTIFRVKKGPSMQIEFKNKQAKKEIQQDTIADRGTSSDDERLKLAPQGRCSVGPSKPIAKQL